MSQVSFADAIKTWARIGCLSFGGPAGQIAMMHKVLVDEKKWLTEQRYLHALNFCMLLPGPEAMQLATYAGWSLHGWRGGLAAGLLFVLPGALVVLVLSMIYASFGQTPVVAALFFGVKAAVLAIVLEALLRVARRALKSALDWWIAAAAFVALFVFDAPFPLVIVVAGVIGFFRTAALSEPAPPVAWAWRQTVATVALWLAIWLAPVAVLLLALGPHHVLSEIALFFSKLAVVTFGGAYAVLSYMAQQAVEGHGWLTAPEMADGLGLAETTPGPLILVTQFVGYLAGYREAGGVWGGIAGALITLWGDLRAVLPVDHGRCPLCRASAAHAPAVWRVGGDHCGSGRRDPQPVGLVRPARAVRPGRPHARLVPTLAPGHHQLRRRRRCVERDHRGGPAEAALGSGENLRLGRAAGAGVETQRSGLMPPGIQDTQRDHLYLTRPRQSQSRQSRHPCGAP